MIGELRRASSAVTPTGALQFRGIGELAVISSFPSVVVVLFALITQLADPWFVFGALSLLYIWPKGGLSRPGVGRLLAVALLAAGTVLALKVGFSAPRPPGSTTATVPGWLPSPFDGLFRGVATDGGFGFPSGHATAATVLYGGVATLAEWRSRRDRFAVAGVVILAVMASRVVLGVHFLVDVIAGGILGAGLLWAGLDRERPAGVFAVAAVIAVAGGVLATVQGYPGEVHEAALVTGSALGGIVGWTLAEQAERGHTGTIRPITGIVGGGTAASVLGGAYAVGGSESTVLGAGGAAALGSILGTVLAATAAIALVVGLPAVQERVSR